MKNILDFIFLLEKLQVSGYQIDSRLIRPGDLFFAIQGEKNDGHDFLSEVQKRGAIGAVVAESYAGPDFGLTLLRVDDVGEALRTLARKSLEISNVQIVGITGSVGKTTTKDFVATLLEGKYRVGKTEKSQNSKLTCPLTILNRASDVEILVLEMGMSEKGDITRLVQIAPPDIAVLTKVALAHAAYFPGGIAEIAKEKRQIFSHPKTKFAITEEIFSEKDCDAFSGIPFEEVHFRQNLAAAIHVARAQHMTDEEIQKRIPHLRLPEMRCERIEKNGILFINDAYNANPASMKAALEALRMMKVSGKKIAVLGTMKELGSFSKDAHAEIGCFAKSVVDHLFVMGEEAKPLCDAFGTAEFCESHEQITKRLKEVAKPGDVVLVKGSRSMSMEKCFCGLSII